MNGRKAKLLSGSIASVFAAGMVAGAGGALITPAAADCAGKTAAAELPAAKSRGGEILLAACNPCQPCEAEHPCEANPCHPCSAEDKH